MEAARIAALRGHNVTLYEKNGAVGGLLDFASTVKGCLLYTSEVGQLGRVRLVHAAVHGDGPLVEEALRHLEVKAVHAGAMTHVVVVGMHPVVGEHAVLALGLLLVDGKLALDVLDVVDAPQTVVLREVPQLQPFAVLGGCLLYTSSRCRTSRRS